MATPHARAALTPSDSSRVCPACFRATSHALLFHKNGSDILRCTNCGLGRAESPAFDPTTYYTEKYFSGGHADGYSDYQGAEAVLRREFAGTVDFIRGFRASGKLLEVGCAYGFFLQEASNYYDVAGIELAEKAAEHCRAQGLPVLNGVADQDTLARIGGVDVIVLLDVIEHLPAPAETLALCSNYLNPEGLIIITTGDFSSIVAKLSGANWRLMTPPQHLWYFTPESIRHLSERLGLLVERIDHPWKSVPASLILFQLRRMLGLPSVRVSAGSLIALPVNLFDAMRLVLRKPAK